MKTKIILASAVCTALFLTSCDSESETPTSSYFEVYNTLTLISPADGTDPVVATPVYKVSQNTRNQMSVSVASFEAAGHKISFDSGFSAFKYGIRELGNLSLEVYTYEKSTTDSHNGENITNLSMIYTNDYVVPSAYSASPTASVDFPYGNYMFLARYDIEGVGTANTFYSMAAFGGETTTSFPGQGGVMQSYTDGNTTFEYAIDTKAMTADIIIYDARFAQQMPSIPVMRVEGLTVKYKTGAIEMTGTGIIPEVLEGGSDGAENWTPNMRYQFDDITFEIKGEYLNVANAHFTVASVFSGSFNGSLTPRK